MEWVETTGRTVEEAKDRALDQLGVDEQDAEFEILEEAKLGLFGRVRAEARVRARVRPTKPRAKEDRRERRRRPKGEGAGAGGGGGGRSRSGGRDGGARGGGEAGGGEAGGAGGAEKAQVSEAKTGGGEAPKRPKQAASEAGGSAGDGKKRGGRGNGRQREREREEDKVSEDVSLAEQGSVAREFLEGLLAEFGAEGTVTVNELDEETVEVAVQGEDLGLLIGPKGATLSALQEVTRTVVQRQTGGRNGRLLVDVASYRQKRKVALERFTQQVADQVKESGVRKVLEPMSPADRKVVHDTVNSIDGVSTTSQGEEPRRRVVIQPE